MNVIIFPNKFKIMESPKKSPAITPSSYQPDPWEYWEAECLADVWVYLFLDKPTVGVIFLAPTEESQAFVGSNPWLRDPSVLICWADDETCAEYQLTELPTNIFFVQGEAAVKAVGLLSQAEFAEGLELAKQVYEAAYN